MKNLLLNILLLTWWPAVVITLVFVLPIELARNFCHALVMTYLQMRCEIAASKVGASRLKAVIAGSKAKIKLKASLAKAEKVPLVVLLAGLLASGSLTAYDFYLDGKEQSRLDKTYCASLGHSQTLCHMLQGKNP